MDWMKLLLVGIGGFAGAICRYISIVVTNSIFDPSFFPYGTLVVNISGCFFIGILTGFFEVRQVISPEIQSLIIVGFLGSFTTYSTFGSEVILLVRQGQLTAAMLNILMHLILGFSAVVGGLAVSGVFQNN